MPASRAIELRDLLQGSDSLAVALIADDGLASLARGRDALLDDDRAALVHLEVALPVRPRPRAVGGGLPRPPRLHRAGLPRGAPARLRGGARRDRRGRRRARRSTAPAGVEAAAHPSEAELAAFIVGCARRRLPFKLTAGLHHALRTTTDEGFEQHGVLNVLAAVDAAAQGADERAVAALLALREVEPVAEALAAGDPRRARALCRPSAAARQTSRSTRSSGSACSGRPEQMPLTSWVPGADGSGRPVEHLPYGCVSTAPGGARGLAVAIGDSALLLGPAAETGLLDVVPRTVLEAATLNPLLALGPAAWAALRARLTDLLTDPAARDSARARRWCRSPAASSTSPGTSPTTSTSTPRSTTPRTSGGSSARTHPRCRPTGGTCRSATTAAPAPSS